MTNLVVPTTGNLNLPTFQKLKFDTELSLSGASFTGSPVLVGTLTNEPVIIMFKNQSSVAVLVSDENGSTKGTTMAIGEEIIIDCRANKGLAPNMGWPINTSFFLTASVGTGAFKISVIYAR
jgi:hypothetical protein